MTQTNHWISRLLVLSLGLTGCSAAKYEAANGDPTGNSLQKIPIEPDYNRPLCEVEYWDQKLDLNLYSYEFVSSDGINFGFNAGGIIKLLGLSVQVDKARLYMNVTSANPYEKEKMYLAQASDTDVKFGVNVDFGEIGVGFNHYSNTPVAKLTREGLMNSIQGLKDKVFSLAKYKEWSTRVLQSPRDQSDKVVIQAGADAGITEGDEFEVYNIKHSWKGDPCISAYQGFEPETVQPIAILKATRGVTTAKQYATLTITDPNVNNSKILPGAYVRQVPAAKGKKLKALARSVKINSITSGDLVLQNGKKIDLTGYMKIQVQDVLQDKKWKGLFYQYSE